MQEINTSNYKQFFNKIVQKIENARYQGFQSINRHNITLNLEKQL